MQNIKLAMSFELKTLISVFILSAMTLNRNCHSFSAMSENDTLSYSEENSFSRVLSNSSEKIVSLPQLVNGVLQFSATKQIRRPRKFDFVMDASDRNRDEVLSQHSSKYMDELRSDHSSSSTRSRNEPTRHKRAIKAGFRGVAPDVPLPIVHCSKEKMTLTATGRAYSHIFVDRVNAAPIPIFQVPPYCGYSVKVTWKDLVLMAPYDGCFIKKENGSHVLSLLWWGSPIKISCPVKPVNSNPAPSVLCSHFGMVIAIEGAQEAPRKHRVKVNGNILPLLSETCAYSVHSSPVAVVLHIPFRSRCVTMTDEEHLLVVILDGKHFTLSCPFLLHPYQFLPYHHSHPFPQSLQPNQEQVPFIPHFPAPTPVPYSTETSKPAVIPYEQHAIQQFHPDHDKGNQVPIHQRPPNHFFPMFPLYHPVLPFDTLPKPSKQQHLPPPVGQIPQIPHYSLMPPPHYSPYPISCPPYAEEFCSQYPILSHHSPDHEPALITAPTIQPIPLTAFPQPTYKPLTPSVIQEALFPQLPLFPEIPPTEPSKMSPSLDCTRNRLMATLPSARMDSIKIKDVKTNTWIAVKSVPADCNYILRSKGGSVVLSSPLPSCHTKKMSPTVISLSLRFWDSSEQRYRTLQLQCYYIGDMTTQATVHPFPMKPLHQIIPHLSTVPTPTRTPIQVVCSSQHMSVKLPPVPTSGLLVQASSSGIKTEVVPLLKAPSHCGYSVKVGKDGAINIILPYSSCHMTQKDGQYRIILKYQTPKGRTVESLLSCQASLSQECNVAPEQQLVCGSVPLSSSECHDRGCCYSADTQLCYYPMDECTMDRHFVFAVHSSIVDPPLSPATLITAGNSSCKPHKFTADFALFKIPLDECGVHRYELGKTIIYMVEILNQLQPVRLNYGTITRDSPVRLLVECRYLPGSVVSVGYLVKNPSLGPSIKAQGVFGVQLRIANDEHYDRFYPQYHQPLRMLLGKPLYLEVRLLNPPDPTATLLVHYCIAYPRSAQSAWILIYDGCQNFLDQTPTHKPPATPAEALTNHVRRFTISTFQFLSEDANLQADEEIYFMCSTEVCMPSDGPCVEGCFADPSNMKS